MAALPTHQYCMYAPGRAGAALIGRLHLKHGKNWAGTARDRRTASSPRLLRERRTSLAHCLSAGPVVRVVGLDSGSPHRRNLWVARGALRGLEPEVLHAADGGMRDGNATTNGANLGIRMRIARRCRQTAHWTTLLRERWHGSKRTAIDTPARSDHEPVQLRVHGVPRRRPIRGCTSFGVPCTRSLLEVLHKRRNERDAVCLDT